MTAGEAKRRLAAIVAADVAGYARLMSRDEAGTHAALAAVRAEVIAPAVAAHGGRVVKTMGDGLLMEFASVVEAVGASMDIQRAMAKRAEGVAPDRRIVFRIGVNLGDVIVEGDDIFGEGVNIAARLESLSEPGGVCLSDAALAQVAGRLELVTEDMGLKALKNIETPVRAHRVRNCRPAGAAAAPAGPAAEDATVPLPAERPSVAIMPFRSLSPDPGAAYIADGVSLGVQTLLVQLSNLFMVNACLHKGYREGEESAAEALRDMPVRHAVEGAVQQAGGRLRVSVRLTALDSGASVWAETYDSDLGDVFALQDEIARRVAAALSVELIGGHTARDFTGALTDPAAWEHFLRGVNFFYRWSPQNSSAALDHFGRLDALTPTSGIAANYLSVLHLMRAQRGWSDDREASLVAARREAERALSREEGKNGLAHAVLGALALRARRHEESLRLCREAVAIRASCPFAISQLGETETYMGDAASGAKHSREALAIRMARQAPLVNTLAIAYRDLGETDLSLRAAEEALRVEPGYVDALATLCVAHALKGDPAAAAEAAARLAAEAPGFDAGAYADSLPYRDPAAARRVAGALRGAGAQG